MYCTIEDVRRILPPSVKIGDNNIGTPTPGSQPVKRDSMSPDEVTQLIQYATMEIDSRLRPFYSCPLRRIKQIESPMENVVYPGTNVAVKVHDSGIFIKGQLLRIQDNANYESAIITNIPDLKTIVLNSITNSYSQFEDGMVSILQFPDPIPLIAARLALSYGFDKLFTSDQSPDVSQYGKEQRKMALSDLDNILTGIIFLFGQEHTGRRFCRGSLLDSFKSPVKDIQFGRESGG